MLRRIQFLLYIVLFLGATQSFAQTVCDPSDVVGENLVVNGDFESGDTGFTTDLPCSWNDAGNCSCHGSFSNSNEYYIANKPSDISVCGSSFQSGWGYTAYEGNNYMIVDGAETPGSVVWAQTVNGIEANTYYYFSVAVTSLSTGNLAQLKFEIQGALQDTTLDAPSTPGSWIVYNQIWYSGATPPSSISLVITDIRPGCGGCPDNNDYGLDAISFQKGCPTDAFDLQPELGPDQTFCGTNGTITLDPGITLDSDNSIYWSTGVNDDDETIDVVTPGKYYVCVNETGTCTKIDSIYLSDDYEIELGNDIELCDPSATTLDAGHSGISVSYQWYQDDVAISGATSKTYYANTSGEFKVEVTDPSCDNKADSLNVTFNSYLPEPTNVSYCIKNNPDTSLVFSVNPSGSMYDWYDSESTSTILPSGSGTDTFTRSGIVNGGDTLWVNNNTMTSQPAVGPNSTAATNNGGGFTIAGYSRTFNAETGLVIDSVQMKGGDSWGTGPCNGISGGNPSAFFKVYLYQNGSKLDSAENVQITCGTPTYITLDFSVPEGDNYSLVPSSGDNGGFYIANDNSAYSIADVITLPSTASNPFPANQSGAFFNWAIRSENACARVPVLAIDNCALPVQFAYFTVSNHSKGVLLNWGTASELNNSHFEILRSTDGLNFTPIAIVDGFGNSDELIQYEYLDENAPTGTTYYMLKQVDYDGASDYSELKAITKKVSFTLNAYPNPFNETITISISSLSEEIYDIEIFDMLGVSVYSSSVSANEETTLGETFPSGLYLVNVVSKTDTQVIKVIKK